MWVMTIAWAGNMSLLSTRTYSGAFTAWLLGQALSALHIHLSAPAFALAHTLIRKLAHLSEYAIFCLLLYCSLAPRNLNRWNTRSAGGALLAAGLFSLVDEYHQHFVPSRTASLVDCGIDTAGALIALLLLYWGQAASRQGEQHSGCERKDG